MVDYARRYHVHIDVGEHVGAYHHSGVVVVECLHHLGKGVFVGINVVGVELYAELACFGVVGAHIPAAADTEVVTFGYDVNHAWVGSEFFDGFRCAVGRVVVDDNQVEGEICLLGKHAANGVANGANSVADRYDY